jgi:hypothetical protein
MIKTFGFGLALFASVLIAGLPASAADLGASPLQKTDMAQTKSTLRYHSARIATIGWLPNSACARRCTAFPVVIGVAY